MVYEVTLYGLPLSRPFTKDQITHLTLVLANLGKPIYRGINEESTRVLRTLPYFPRALWSAQSLALTLYGLLGPHEDAGPDTGPAADPNWWVSGLIDGVTVTTSGGRPYQSRTLDQPSDEEQPAPWRYTLDVDTQTFTPEPTYEETAA